MQKVSKYNNNTLTVGWRVFPLMRVLGDCGAVSIIHCVRLSLVRFYVFCLSLCLFVCLFVGNSLYPSLFNGQFFVYLFMALIWSKGRSCFFTSPLFLGYSRLFPYSIPPCYSIGCCVQSYQHVPYQDCYIRININQENKNFINFL